MFHAVVSVSRWFPCGERLLLWSMKAVLLSLPVFCRFWDCPVPRYGRHGGLPQPRLDFLTAFSAFSAPRYNSALPGACKIEWASRFERSCHRAIELRIVLSTGRQCFGKDAGGVRPGCVCRLIAPRHEPRHEGSLDQDRSLHFDSVRSHDTDLLLLIGGHLHCLSRVHEHG